MDYARGFKDGWFSAYEEMGYDYRKMGERGFIPQTTEGQQIKEIGKKKGSRAKRKGKLSAYNKFVKANASKPRFKYKSGSKKGRINMKKIAAAWKKTTTYKKSKKK